MIQGPALGRNCDVALDARVREEACPHDLAPTTSTTVALVLGDALAVALLQEKGFQREDFARIHPGGALGRKLVIQIQDIMLRDELPVLSQDATMRDAIVMIAERRGIAIVIDGENHVDGLLTAGDLSRMIERGGDIFPIAVRSVMTANPKIARIGELASAVAYRMEQHGIMAVPVVDEGSRLCRRGALARSPARASGLMRRIVAFAFSTCIIAIAACKDTTPLASTAAPSAADSADQIFINAHSILTTKGVQRAELIADTAFVMDEGTRFNLRNPHVNFTTETGQPEGTMDAQKGVYNSRTQMLEGWGDAVVKFVDGRKLTSPHVTYNQLTHQISSDTSYTITGPTGTQYGIGLMSIEKNGSFTSFSCARNCGGNSSVRIPEK